jgi:hypothetical protein
VSGQSGTTRRNGVDQRARPVGDRSLVVSESELEAAARVARADAEAGVVLFERWREWAHELLAGRSGVGSSMPAPLLYTIEANGVKVWNVSGDFEFDDDLLSAAKTEADRLAKGGHDAAVHRLDQSRGPNYGEIVLKYVARADSSAGDAPA